MSEKIPNSQDFQTEFGLKRVFSVADMWREFVSSTTLHGLSHVFNNTSIYRRSIWLLLLLASTAYYVYTVSENIQKFLSYPSHTEIFDETPPDGRLPFPTVTICNLNHYVKTKIKMAEDDPRFSELGLNISACAVIKRARGNLTCAKALLCAQLKVAGPALMKHCDGELQQRIIFALNQSSERVFNSEEFLRAYGQNISSMFVKYCRFSTHEFCFEADFQRVITQSGLCFSFNPPSDRSVPHSSGSVRASSRTGLSGGLGVVLDVQTDEDAYGDLSLGLRVLVHDQGAITNTERGFDVPPGSHVVVSVTAKKVRIMIIFVVFICMIKPGVNGWISLRGHVTTSPL